MTTWTAILVGSGAAFATKYAGHVVPARWLSGRRVAAVMALMPVTLLAALVMVQGVVGPGGAPAPDARLAGLAAAAVALRLRAPYLLVVLIGAAAAAGLRALGWAS